MRFGGWLALSALAIQLALSFGHIHSEDFGPANGIQIALDADQAGEVPANSDHKGIAHSYCDICATISLLATLVVPTPPVLAHIVAQDIAPLVAAHRERRIGPVTRLFQARAPPSV
jgi:hypothetical protein